MKFCPRSLGDREFDVAQTEIQEVQKSSRAGTAVRRARRCGGEIRAGTLFVTHAVSLSHILLKYRFLFTCLRHSLVAALYYRCRGIARPPGLTASTPKRRARVKPAVSKTPGADTDSALPRLYAPLASPEAYSPMSTLPSASEQPDLHATATSNSPSLLDLSVQPTSMRVLPRPVASLPEAGAQRPQPQSAGHGRRLAAIGGDRTPDSQISTTRCNISSLLNPVKGHPSYSEQPTSDEGGRGGDGGAGGGGGKK